MESKWITGMQAMEVCQWRTAKRRKEKGVEKPFREWLASIGVPCTRWGERKTWMVDGELLARKLDTLSQMKAAGLDDLDIMEQLGGFKLTE
jgi:hypothetical protein